jgi:hypothetical protein
MKRLLGLLILLGIAGAVVYLLRARGSEPPTALPDWRRTPEDTRASAPPMRVRDAGSATA